MPPKARKTTGKPKSQSQVQAQSRPQPLTGWYTGLPTLERTIADYATGGYVNADDKEAYVLYRELQEGLGEGVDPERVRSRLEKLSSSWLASFLIQLQDAASKNREKRDSAQRVLKGMAMDAFDPAVAWLARDITPDMLVGRAKPSVVGRIGWGVSQCNVYCVLVHARVRQRLHYPFNNESAGRDLATALYAAAEKKS